MATTTAPERPSRPRRVVPHLGAAFVAAIAYVDPGNFATNIAGGAEFGYLLLWVVLTANLMGVLIQNLSAKVGVATRRNLPQLCRELFPRPVSWGLWVQAELIAMATDLAEFVGAAIALNLLFDVPLFPAGLITAVVAFAVLSVRSRGYRGFELTIAAMLGVILLGFLYDALQIGGDAGDVAGGFVPGFQGSESVLFATGILGAPVMPHVIYLHSALTQNRLAAGSAVDRRFLFRHQQADVFLAMGLAGIINLSMLLISAALFFDTDVPDTDTLEGVHAGLARVLDQPAAVLFALALLASGFASSGVGTYAGQVVMQGFIRRSLPLLLRRGLTIAPALVVLAVGLDPTRALVFSQVVLSFGIPFALVPLVLLTRRADIMGELVNRKLTTTIAALAAAMIITLNAFLIVR